MSAKFPRENLVGLDEIRIQHDEGPAVYRQITRQLESLITSGQIKPGQRLPTDRELATQLNVHPLTVRRSFSELKELGLVERHRGRGSFVRETKNHPQKSVVVLLPDWAEIYAHAHLPSMNHEFLAGIERHLQQAGVGMRILTLRQVPVGAELESWAQRIRETHEGALTIQKSYFPLLGRLREMGMPVVTYHWRADPSAQLSSAVYDRKQAWFQMTEHLIKLGRKRIGFFGQRPDEVAGGLRSKFDGYLAALEAYDLPYYPSHLIRATSDFYSSAREEALEAAIREKRIGDALVVDGRDSGPLALRILQQHGYSVPQDVAVVGHDEPYAGATTQPALTWGYVPRYEIGQAAAEIVVRQMQSGDLAAIHQCVEARLVQGRSCGHPQGGDGRMELPSINIPSETGEIPARPAGERELAVT